jgi:hypothetical protein
MRRGQRVRHVDVWPARVGLNDVLFECFVLRHNGRAISGLTHTKDLYIAFVVGVNKEPDSSRSGRKALERLLAPEKETDNLGVPERFSS